MTWVSGIGAILIAYLLGSFPTGLVVVYILTRKDLRNIESGRTGGTNAMRAGGFGAGLITAILDLLKATLAVHLARILTHNTHWLEVMAGLIAILGHNYSIFLLERKNGIVRLRGGAGGASTVGAAMGLWFPSVFFTVPIGVGLLYGLGYASVATMSVAFTSMIIFILRASFHNSPWEYILFGIFAELILVWALRPNILRLIKGQERLVGWRARKKLSSSKTPNHNPE